METCSYTEYTKDFTAMPRGQGRIVPTRELAVAFDDLTVGRSALTPFTVLSTFEGKLLWWESHWSRLFTTFKGHLDITQPQLLKIIAQVLAENKADKDYAVKIMFVAGQEKKDEKNHITSSGRVLFIKASPLPDITDGDSLHGCINQIPYPGAKVTLNYQRACELITLSRTIVTYPIDDIFYVDPKDLLSVTDGSTFSIGAVTLSGDYPTLILPPYNGKLLVSITRMQIVKIIKETMSHQLGLEIKFFNIEQMQNALAVICMSATGVRFAGMVNGVDVNDGVVPEVALELRKNYFDAQKKYSKMHS